MIVDLQARPVTPDPFVVVPIENALGLVFRRAGVGKPLIVVQLGRDAAPERFHALLAEACEVTFVSRLDAAPLSADEFAELLAMLDRSNSTMLVSGSSVGPALDHLLTAPDAVAGLVMMAPLLDVRDGYAGLATPVLVIEGAANVDAPELGQRLTSVIPECYHILVYDASEALDRERPEAVAEAVADFAERGRAFIVAKPKPALFA